ncbi:MAG TPA: hypothetical protein VKA53_01055 [Thermoanaerobaculia bacterium]|nr:hypothetical protein [Thermoanaerobaculia bacterium]
MKWTGLRLQGGALALAAILAILIWAFSRSLASSIWRGRPEAPQDSPFPTGALQIGLFSATGLLLIGLALPGIVREVVEYWNNMTGQTSFDHSGTRAIGLAVQLLVGLWLLFGSGFFAGLASWRCKMNDQQTDS